MERAFMNMAINEDCHLRTHRRENLKPYTVINLRIPSEAGDFLTAE
jgi:hypothetical protein